jgi:hypothetical protein
MYDYSLQIFLISVSLYRDIYQSHIDVHSNNKQIWEVQILEVDLLMHIFDFVP